MVAQTMPRPLRDFDRHDWARLRPLTQGYKTLRYAASTALYVRRGRCDPGLLASLRGRPLVCSIAYNDDWAIDRQSRLMRRHLVDAEYLVADNSSDPAASARIAAICADRRIAYARLPKIRLRPGSRSHGLALNWVCRNVVMPAAPPAFGFVDHDIFPTAPFSLVERLRTQPVYGRCVDRGARWYLWAGFCFFRTDVLRTWRLDFSQDWFIGLDTGGANWRYYATLDRAALAFPNDRVIRLAGGGTETVDLIGDWIHYGNASGWREGAASKRALVDAMLAPHLADANQPASLR